MLLTSSGVSTARFTRCLHAELRNVRTTRGIRWTLGITVSLWVVVGAGVAAINLLLDPGSVSIAGALLGVGSAVTVFVPILAILIVAADWQSRDVMTTFTLEPRRHIVFFAKAVTVLIVCLALVIFAAVFVVVLAVSLALATGSGVGWNTDTSTVALLLGGTTVGMISGLAYAAATQRVVIAIVFSLIQGFALDPLLMLVPHGAGSWFRLAAISEFVSGSGQLTPAISAGVLWLVVPLTTGFVRHQRADVQ
ncbi:ABC transporter permease [Microbacterium sp. CFBP 8794]|nr:ABC transporter permease [Microbacterium sp. CFBP 8794]